MRRSGAPSASSHKPVCPHTLAFAGARGKPPPQAPRRPARRPSQPSIAIILSPCTAGTAPITQPKACGSPPGTVLSGPPLSGCTPLGSLSSQRPSLSPLLHPRSFWSPFQAGWPPLELRVEVTNHTSHVHAAKPHADFQSSSNLPCRHQDTPVRPPSSERFLIRALGLGQLPSVCDTALPAPARHTLDAWPPPLPALVSRLTQPLRPSAGSPPCSHPSICSISGSCHLPEGQCQSLTPRNPTNHVLFLLLRCECDCAVRSPCVLVQIPDALPSTPTPHPHLSPCPSFASLCSAPRGCAG